MKLDERHLWAILRIALGLIFLWAFFDKVFGLGFATAPENAWILGKSPTQGFLEFGTAGPFAPIFQSLAGSIIVDWLFMLGLLGIGLALVLGIGMKIASVSGALMMFLMWLAHLPPEHHPFLDEHLIYLVAILALAKGHSGEVWGLGKWWKNTKLVKKYPILE